MASSYMSPKKNYPQYILRCNGIRQQGKAYLINALCLFTEASVRREVCIHGNGL